MSILLSVILLIILFIILGISANFAVNNIKILSKKLRIKIFAIGIILGIMTSLPELMLGINAVIKNIPHISAGNILGGIPVLFGLILGISLVLNRKVETDGKLSSLLPQILFILFPVILGFDGKFDAIDGILIIIFYVSLMFFMYHKHKNPENLQISIIREQKIVKSVFIIIISVIVLMLASNLIITISANLLQKINIRPFIVGLLLFSIGTNLPELSITLSSWRKKSPELSLSHLMGSAMSQKMILGLISLVKQVPIVVDLSYFVLALFIVITLFLVIVFYKTDKSLNRIEGAFLVFVYFLFLIINIFIQARIY